MASRTPIKAFMDMPVSLFYDFVRAISEVIKARNKK